MVSFVDLSKKYTNPRDQAWREGKGPYKGSLGPNKTPEDPLRDQWMAMFRDSPDAPNFYNDSYTFPGETAKAAQQKIDNAAWDSQWRGTNLVSCLRLILRTLEEQSYGVPPKSG